MMQHKTSRDVLENLRDDFQLVKDAKTAPFDLPSSNTTSSNTDKAWYQGTNTSDSVVLVSSSEPATL